jgi:hypothetical protein
LKTLDAIAGGAYWKPIALDRGLSYTRRLGRFTEAYQDRMRSSFTYVASCEIKAKYNHKVPKYYLIYGTRHEDGLELINDAMCKARDRFLGKQFRRNTLFDLTPQEEVQDHSALRHDLLSLSTMEGSLSRKALRLKSLRGSFGRYETKDYNGAIAKLLEEGKLTSSTGKIRVNDDVILSPAKPTTADRRVRG